jgi:hypothetical protein
MIKRLIYIGIIGALATLAWWSLGGIILARTQSAYGGTRGAVKELWGPNLEQVHPQSPLSRCLRRSGSTARPH